MSWFGDIFKEVPFLGSVISAGANYASAKEANRQQVALQEDAQAYNAEEAAKARTFNAEQAGIARMFSAEQAQHQMDFQERMAGSMHQRETADLKAAGLNPILSRNAGAAVPVGSAAQASSASGPSASSPGVPTVHRAQFGDLLASALSLAQIEQVETAAQANRAEADLKWAQAREIRDRFPDTWDSVGGELFPRGLSAREQLARTDEIRARTNREIASADLSREEAELVRKQVDNALKSGKEIEARTGNYAADTVLKELAQSEARAASAFWKRYPGAYDAGQGLKLLGGAMNAANPLSRLLGR